MRIAAINQTYNQNRKNNKQNFGNLVSEAERDFRYGEISRRFGVFLDLSNIRKIPATLRYVRSRVTKVGTERSILPWEQDTRVVIGLMRLLNGETFEPIIKL